MQESGEMYLETILVLKNNNEFVRSIDVAKHLGFSKPSVSRGVGILKSEGYIVIDDNGHIDLTDKGDQKAKYIYEKHRILTEFLMKITNVSKEIAEVDACKIEHVISDEVFAGIKNYLND
ncbi:MAG: metal-dependent transcriptional regulator [Thomasclavelia sp.]|nr:metal-dependent transcriptional regulator [Thomasclavelia sp.]